MSTAKTRNMGRSPHQRNAHDLLVEHGFVFDHANGKRANVYVHRDGRKISVNATPRNETVAIQTIKQNVRSPRLGLKTGESPPQTRGTEMPTPTPTKTAPLVAMADPFLLKPAETKQQKAARQSALAGWVRRVLERQGPLASNLLDDAAGEMGFSRWQIVRARGECGAIAWREGGRDSGWLVGLPHQKPENRKSYSDAVATNGVQPVAEELPSGAVILPEPVRPHPSAVEQHPLVAAAVARVPEHEPEGLTLPQPPPKAFGSVEIKDSDVAAAAQMLLDTLGIKGFDPKVVESLRSALAQVKDCRDAADAAVTRIERALELMT